LNRGNTTVLVETTTTTETASAVTPGDTYRVAGRTLGTVERVYRYPTPDPGQQRLLLGLSLRTIEIGGERRFGNTRLQTGATITFDTSAYTLEASLVERDTLAPPGDPTTVNTTVELRDVGPSVANNFYIGAAERINGSITARVTDIETAPAIAIVESDDGQIYGRDHPRLKNVTLAVELTARRDGDRLLFHGRPLREDRPILLELPTITVEGRLTDIEP
jgi:hypothetical protein